MTLLTFMDLSTLLKDEGVALIRPRNSPLDNSELTRLDLLSDRQRLSSSYTPYQNVLSYPISRTDIGSSTYVQQKPEILEILGSEKMTAFYKELFKRGGLRIKSCVVHLMWKEGSISEHSDDKEEGTDYLFSVVLQLSQRYKGGEFVVHTEEGARSFKLGQNSMLAFRSHLPHEVLEVTGGTRKTIAYFLG